MKKTTALLTALLIIFSFSACSGNSDEDSIANGERIVSQQSSDAVSETVDPESSVISSVSENSFDSSNSLLMKNFGALWMGDAYYIDVMMTQEYDPSKLSSAVSESSSELKTVNYDYIIAVDFQNNIAGLNMLSDVGNQSTLVKDNYIYEINHEKKTYTKKIYQGQAEDFGAEFTVKVCLGTVNNCTFIENGNTSFRDQNVKFEKYSVPSQVPGIDGPVLTYYFDSSDKPVAETVELDGGTTTFIFRTVSSSIQTQAILNIPDGYEEVEQSSSKSS